MRSERGFSLIELVLVMILLGIFSVPLITLFARSTGSFDEDVAIQTGAQAVQQCAEHALGVRRRSTLGYSTTFDANSCDTPAPPAGYTRTLTITNGYTGGACPGGATCKRVQISVSETSHGTVASGDLVLVQ
jgi:prepilin-type N-terminal cleavage/methylation domain-containing protein